MKKGDKIRYNGSDDWSHSTLTVGKVYRIESLGRGGSDYAVIKDDNGDNHVWSYGLTVAAKEFTLVAGEGEDAFTVKVGDFIEFLGADGFSGRYRDTIVGKAYKVCKVELGDKGHVAWAYYIDDAGDEVQWNFNLKNEQQHFYITNQERDNRIEKDDELATPHIKQDLEAMMDLALDLEDIAWAQDIYNQIQQLEGEHA